MGIKCGIFGPTGMNYDHLAITQNVILDMGENSELKGKALETFVDSAQQQQE